LIAEEDSLLEEKFASSTLKLNEEEIYESCFEKIILCFKVAY